MTYKLFRNSLGVVDAINRESDGATVPVWDPSDPLTVEFQLWLADHPEFEAELADRPDLAYTMPFQADWDSYFDNNLSLLASLLAASPEPQIADFLKIEFGKRPGLDAKRLSTYWNGAIASIPPTTEQIAVLNQCAEECRLPVRLNDLGQMILVEF